MSRLGILFVCYALFLLPPFLAELWKEYSGVHYLYAQRRNYILNTALILAWLSLFLALLTHLAGRFRRWLFVPLLAVLAILGTFNLVHVALYDAPLSVGAVDALLGTNIQEAAEYLSFHWSWPVILSMVFYGIFFLGMTILCWRCLAYDRRGSAWSSLLVGSLALGLAFFAYRFPGINSHELEGFRRRSLYARFAEINRQLPSLRFLHDIGHWLEYRRWLEEKRKTRLAKDFGASLLHPNEPRTLVLVLGESLRRDRMSLYGYDRPTTPNLEARRRQMLVFDRAISPSNQTMPSWTNALTLASIEDPDRFLTEPSIVAAAKKAGYRTYWLSNQGRIGPFDTLISMIADEADKTVFTNTEFYGTVYDEALLRPLEDVLEENYPHKLIVLHVLGSHQSYRSRYPVGKAVFLAKDYAVSGGEEALVFAEYDNSVRYTDEVLGKILGMLEKKAGSLLLFVGDHGERLYDEGGGDVCGHGFPEPIRSEFDVPYFLWCNGDCSSSWKRSHARHRGLPFNTEDLFHTAANLLGLKMAAYRSQDDILSPKYLPDPMPKIIDVNRKVHSYFSLP